MNDLSDTQCEAFAVSLKNLQKKKMYLDSPSCNCLNYFSDYAVFFHGKLHYIRTEMRKDVGKKQVNTPSIWSQKKTQAERKNEKAAFWRRACMRIRGSHHSSCVWGRFLVLLSWSKYLQKENKSFPGAPSSSSQLVIWYLQILGDLKLALCEAVQLGQLLEIHVCKEPIHHFYSLTLNCFLQTVQNTK